MAEEKPDKLPKDHPDHWHQRRLTGDQFNGLRGKGNMEEKRERSLAKYREKLLAKMERIKVREGESFNAWSARTKQARASLGFAVEPSKKEREAEESRKIRAFVKKQAGYKLKADQIQIVQRETNLLKYYAVVMNWASANYDLSRDILEYSYALLDSTGFSKETFLVTAKGFGYRNGIGMWKKLMNRGYLYAPKQTKLTEALLIYTLHKNYKKVLVSIYKILNMEKAREFGSSIEAGVIIDNDARHILNELTQKTLEIKLGKAKPSYIDVTN